MEQNGKNLWKMKISRISSQCVELKIVECEIMEYYLSFNFGIAMRYHLCDESQKFSVETEIQLSLNWFADGRSFCKSGGLCKSYSLYSICMIFGCVCERNFDVHTRTHISPPLRQFWNFNKFKFDFRHSCDSWLNFIKTSYQ